MRIGIDLGGTKTEIIALHADNGKELYRKRVPSPRDDYPATIDNMKNLVLEAEQTLGQTGTVGVGIPGVVSRITGKVKNANSTWLIGHPLDKDLSEALSRPVLTENDANCFALSEATDGAGKGAGTVFAVIIGTGTGAGIIVNGQVLVGRNQIGGEWGHNQLSWPSVEEVQNHPDCYCGLKGCVETYLSGPGFKAEHKRVTGRDWSTHDIRAAVDKGDEGAVAAMHRYEDRLARCLANVINILDPDVVVLGGGMSNLPNLYEAVPKIWGKYIFSDTIQTQLKPALHGDSSGVRGAAWLGAQAEKMMEMEKKANVR